jgi:hypothetical protein
MSMQESSEDWWVEIMTTKPHCIYYFGPFSNREEAVIAYSGYVEDLENEGAQGIVVVIKRCAPKILTICDEDEDDQDIT